MRINIKTFALLAVAFFIAPILLKAQNQPSAAPKVEITKSEKTKISQWKGKRVAFLGDSMTDKRRAGTTCVYWEYLTELLGIDPYVYGISGHQWTGIYKQAVQLKEEKGTEIDAIIIFAGTNDYNASVPVGSFFNYSQKEAIKNGVQTTLNYRSAIITDSTFCGRINKVLDYIKQNFPTQQVIILSPIHRGFAQFSDTNIQPEESFSNKNGVFLDTYVNTLKDACSLWSVPMIDLYTISGLYPMTEAHSIYIPKPDTDRLHPNANGHYRLAKTLQYQLLTLPSGF